MLAFLFLLVNLLIILFFFLAISFNQFSLSKEKIKNNLQSRHGWYLRLQFIIKKGRFR